MPSQPINNRHIIDDALNVLATALSPFVATKTGGIVHTDASALLSNMLGRWDDAFHTDLGYRGKNLVYEIRDIRNDWAHYTKSLS
ncbi:MAG: Swt1 family HEPN domain-containing protein [Chloroflexota bacterium]|nr:Swt1 family HEPN domain-containing protein [Chloroflexota bacterium]